MCVSKEAKYYLMNENQFIAFCNCGCGNGVVLKFDNEEDELSVQLVSDNYYTIQTKGKMLFKEKVKRIWYIITGKEYCFFDILMDKNDLQRFKKYIEKL